MKRRIGNNLTVVGMHIVIKLWLGNNLAVNIMYPTILKGEEHKDKDNKYLSYCWYCCGVVLHSIVSYILELYKCGTYSV
jgi:hypothetical protein